MQMFILHIFDNFVLWLLLMLHSIDMSFKSI